MVSYIQQQKQPYQKHKDSTEDKIRFFNAHATSMFLYITAK